MPDKGELESHREETFIDDIIQKSHIEKELAEKEGVLDKIIFVNGALENLSDFKVYDYTCLLCIAWLLQIQ